MSEAASSTEAIGDTSGGAAAPASTGSSRASYPERRELFDPRRKSPLIAAILSLVPGLGQIYVGYYARGLVIAATVMLLIVIGGNAGGSLEGAVILSVFFTWLFNLVDAGRVAALYNHATTGQERIELPRDFELPGIGGSIFGGIALTAFGAIALSHTLFGYPLVWLESWWPIFPLALGVYLLVRGVMDRTAGSA